MGSTSDGEQPIDAAEIAAVEADRVLGELPARERLALSPGSSYASEAVRLWEEQADPGRRASIQDFVRSIVFRDLIEHFGPTGSQALIDYASEEARGALKRRDREFAPSYGEAVADVGADRAIGYFALVDLGKAIAGPIEIANVVGYLDTIVKRAVTKIVDGGVRATAPGVRAHHHLVKRHEKRLAESEPELTDEERGERARRAAQRESARRGGFLSIERGEGVIDDVPDERGDGIDEALGASVVDWIRRMIDEDPHFTETDRDTFRIWEAAGFDGRAIDWKAAGPTPHTGSQRVSALKKKLRRLLSESGY